jgi:uncharacterized membrane protein
MLHLILLVTFLLGFPMFIMWAEGKSKVIRWISPIIICYLAGIVIGNIPGWTLNREVLEKTTMIAVVLAIPLLLFSANLMVMLKQVRPALFSFSLGIAAVVTVSVLAYLIFCDRVSEASTVSGMMIGVYTGGTQNMSAIGMALDAEKEVFVLLNSADIVFSGIYLIFLMTVAKGILGIFLPSKMKLQHSEAEQENEQASSESKGRVVHVLAGLVLAALLAGISIGVSYLILGRMTEPIVILGITTLGIAASFVRKIRVLPLTFSTANYLLLLFALTVGSMANLTELLAASSMLFWFCGFMVFGSVIMHVLLAILFRVDRDTLIITSTAAIFGPAFIGPVANAIGNKGIIPIGIALGIIGLAIGNYLGLSIAYLLN